MPVRRIPARWDDIGLPRPHPDRAAPREDTGAACRHEARELVGVEADKVEGAVLGGPKSAEGELAVVLAEPPNGVVFGRHQLGGRGGDGNLRRAQRPDIQPRGLADAERAGEVADDVDPDRRRCHIVDGQVGGTRRQQLVRESQLVTSERPDP